MKKVILILSMLVIMVGFSSCRTLGPSPEQISAQIEKAGEARQTLWVNLQTDRKAFTEAQWGVLSGLHSQAMLLAADIEVELSLGTYPDTSTVVEWKTVGDLLLKQTSEILDPMLPQLSTATQAAWVIEKARYRALASSAQHYINNPNAASYRRVAGVGLAMVGALL